MRTLQKVSILMAGTLFGFAAGAMAEAPMASEKELAACMWEKAPDDAQRALDTQSPFQLAIARANGGQVCGAPSTSVNIEKILEALRDAKPKKTKNRD